MKKLSSFCYDSYKRRVMFRIEHSFVYKVRKGSNLMRNAKLDNYNDQL